MKTILAMIIMSLSASAFAFMTEVECELILRDKTVIVEIEQPFPETSIYRQAKVIVVKDGVESSEESTVSARMSLGIKEINYFGSKLNMNVNLWPDSRPRWGRTYQGTIYSSDIAGNERISNMECRFPFAQ